jgi:hypothetical protein
MDGFALVDTNVLLRLRQQGIDLCIVPQNLVEFWAVATRPVASNGLGMSPLAIAGEMRGLRNLFRLLEDTSGISHAWEKQDFKQYESVEIIAPGAVSAP